MPVPKKERHYQDNAECIILENCWGKTINGKPGINVLSHCENVGCVAETLIRQIPLSFREKFQTNTASTLAAVQLNASFPHTRGDILIGLFPGRPVLTGAAKSGEIAAMRGNDPVVAR